MPTMYILHSSLISPTKRTTLILFVRLLKTQKRATRIKGGQWHDMMFEMSVDVHKEVMRLLSLHIASTNDLQEHFSFLIADRRGKTGVSLRNLNAEERKLMEEATDKEVDQCISNPVLNSIRRIGSRLHRSWQDNGS